MFKVVLWDYTGESESWTKNYLKNEVKIIRTLRPDDPDQAEIIMRGDWDFVLIFEKDQRELFNEIFKTMHEMNVATDNIIFANDFNSLANNPAAVYALMKPELCDNLYRNWTFQNHRRWHKYISASAEDLHYLATAADNFVIRYIFQKSKNHTDRELKLFCALTKKYYGINSSGGGYILRVGREHRHGRHLFLQKNCPEHEMACL